MKRTVSATEARRGLDELLEGVRHSGDEVVIELDGEAMAVVIPIHRYESLERQREEFWRLIEAGQAGNDHLSEDEVAEIVEREIAAVREEARSAVRPTCAP